MPGRLPHGPVPPPSPARPLLAHPYFAAGTLALFAALRFSWRLTEPLTGDSIRYAVVSLDMVESGDWLHPVHGGGPYFQKPPLVPWLGALSMAAFGKSVAAVSLPSVLAGIGVVLAAWRVASRFGGPLAGLLAGLGLLLTPSFVRITGTLRMDAPLLLAAIGVLWAVERAREKPAWFALAWLFLALGVLTKGTPGLYPLGVLAGAAVLLRRGFPFSHPAFWKAAPVFVVALAPWYVHMTATYGRAFWDVHLGKEVGDRFALSAAGRSTLDFLWESLRFPALLLPLSVLGAVFSWRDGRGDPALRRAAALGIVWIAGISLGQVVNANGFARHMYSTFAAAACLSGYGVARLLGPRVRPEWLVGPLLAVSLVWLGLRVARVPPLGVRAQAEHAAVLDAVDREVPSDPVLVYTLRANEAGDFLRFHRGRTARRITLQELDALLSAPGAAPLRVLVDDRGRREAEARGARFIAKGDAFSLALFPPRD